jgi:hypothetical protein
MTPTTAREFAERLYATSDEERPERTISAFAAMVEADRLATAQAALAPFVALAERWESMAAAAHDDAQRAFKDEGRGAMFRAYKSYAAALETRAREVRALTTQAPGEKAVPT